MTVNKDFQILKWIQWELLKEISLDFKRDYFDIINWEEKVVGLIWERWVGKTTIMLQKIKETWEWFYFSADNSITKINWLFKFCYYLYSEYDIKTFYIDEIHKYENWTVEIKNIYDSMPNIKLVFSGSSSLDLYKWVLDLSRRVDFYNIYPLNYREFLKLFYALDIPSFEFDEIIKNHKKISLELSSITKDKYFEEYIKIWYYPFSKAITTDSFTKKIQILLDKIILEDLPVFLDFRNISLDWLRKMFYFISNTTPSELSFTNLWNKVGLNKIIIQNTLVLLNKIGLVALIPKFWNMSDRVRKEYKIILWNPNLYNAYSKKTDIWILRESFFVSQLRKVKNSDIFLPKAWDFVLERFDEVFYFEVWWKNKNQSSYPKNTFIVKDDIKISENDYIIPLWLFWLIK
jgi:hypothetical protein